MVFIIPLIDKARDLLEDRQNDQKRAALTGQLRTGERMLKQLLDRKGKLVAAKTGVSHMIDVSNLAKDSAVMYRARVIECVGISTVQVHSQDWAGVSAVTFINSQAAVAKAMSAKADEAEALLAPFSKQLQDKVVTLADASGKIQVRIQEVDREIQALADKLANLRCAIAAIPN